ncbi:GerAB/ArcD/ProY family transporter [Paenibacillus odorifer]|uniref:GerAB/ArcD/ProY family transporter n=1 Tax=Paenibacillus odorifer TaxID=189426 RepID=UPI00117FBDD3|nr:endospore germination permease [Paenibacillus odorifer]
MKKAMLEKGKISTRQLTILVMFLTIGDSILVIPPSTSHYARQNAWISALIGMIVGLLAIYMYSKFVKLYPKLTLIEAIQKAFGKWIGTILSFLTLMYFLIVTVGSMRELSEFVTSEILPRTPIPAVLILFMVIVIMATRLGIEVIGRAGEIFTPMIIILFLILTVAIIPQMEIVRLLPILEDGIKPVLRGSISITAYTFIEPVVFLMFLPYVNQQQKITKGLLQGCFLGGIIIFLTVTISILVLGPDLTTRDIYPSYNIARRISVGGFFERVEAMIALLWMLTLFIEVTLYFYAFVLGLSQLFKLKEYRVLTLPTGLILVTLAPLIAPNYTYYNKVFDNYWVYYVITFGLFLPLVLLGVGMFRRALDKGLKSRS